ncbi:MAG: 2-phosphosulfolactate phosphatase, partial [Flavobacteriales bacterium]|nr:2-phosphosulfolactate phosphatase [Flavobacteriales bacterium]
PMYHSNERIVVIVDILRATSAICTALQHGMKSVIPVATIDQANQFVGDDYIIAAERGGEIVNGFAYGNSPLAYINNPQTFGKHLVLTTTNGTQAIETARLSQTLVIGSFCNISALTQWIVKRNQDVMILCAGWKNRINLEDTIFAGALLDSLLRQGFSMDIDTDAGITALSLFRLSEADIKAFLKQSSHNQRLSRLNLDEDITYCLTRNTTPIVPILQQERLVIST